MVSAATDDVSASRLQDPRQVIQAIRKMDPTNGKFLQYLIGRYIAREFRLEDHARVRAALEAFTQKRQGLAQKDITQYKSIHDLYDAVEGAPDPELSKKQQVKDIKGRGAETVVKTPTFTIVRLMSSDAATFYAAGTKWCTSNSDMFKRYASRGDIFVIMVKDKSGKTRKFQLHYQLGQLMDEKDRLPSDEDIALLSSHPEWYDFVDQLASRHWHEY